MYTRIHTYTCSYIRTCSTVGIDIQECTINSIQEYPTNISLKLWDFAGQKLYHSVHELFFSQNALYMLMWNVNIEFENEENNEFDEHVQFWIDLINARAPVSVLCKIITSLHLLFSFINGWCFICKWLDASMYAREHKSSSLVHIWMNMEIEMKFHSKRNKGT